MVHHMTRVIWCGCFLQLFLEDRHGSSIGLLQGEAPDQALPAVPRYPQRLRHPPNRSITYTSH